MIYRCPTCTKEGGEDKSLKEVIVDLQASIREMLSLKNDILELKKSVPQLKSDLEALKKSSLSNNAKNVAKINIIESKVNSLSLSDGPIAKIATLENDIKGLNDSSANGKLGTYNMQQTINELEERKARECNLFIYNIPDADTKDFTNDAISVANALFKIVIILIEHLKCFLKEKRRTFRCFWYQ